MVETKFKGFSNIEEMEVHCFECEKCSYQSCYFDLYKGKSQCPKCKHVHEETKFVSITKKAVICSVCGEKVTLMPENFTWPFYMCPNPVCHNMVAIQYENKIYQPSEPLKRSFNNNVEKGIKLDDNLLLLKCEDERSLFVIDIFNEMAISKESSFLRFKEEYHKIAILYDDSQVLGYIMWSEENDEIILRQLFVLESFRNNGYGTLLIDEWVKNFVDPRFNKFEVQYPSPTTTNILIRLGYLSWDEKNSKCSLIP